ncbi:MAG: NAD(P)-binding domain-containing protein [Arthrobacter sp.]
MNSENTLPVIIIGAGPIGLAAAAQLRERDQEVLVLESGATPGAAISDWGHIKLFSTWRYDIDPAARRLLETPAPGYAADWQAPPEAHLPTGAELVADYLVPLAEHPELAPRIRYNHRVTHVSRVHPGGKGIDRTRTAGREDTAFLIRVATPDGETELLGRAVLDASGTWNTPNPVGRSGLEALGEAEARRCGFITSPLPDPLGEDQDQLAGKTVLVLGAGHSAANTLISLGRLRQRNPETRILWGLRGAADPVRLYGGGAADQLPARGQLGASLRRLVESGDVTIEEDFSITQLASGERLTVRTADGRELTVDALVPATGFRPDLRPLAEMRLDLDPAVEAPRSLGSLIDPEFHSCGTVPAHGESVLAPPEPGFYMVGAKSYGRAPTFLLATGYEQVRSVAAALAGDRCAADAVELELGYTGVCSGEPAETEDASCGEATACGAEEQDNLTDGAGEPVAAGAARS